MKKIIALMLSVILVFGIIGTQVSANTADQIVEKIAEYSKEDRASMLLLIKSFVVSDSGVDLLVDAVKKYDPSSTDMMSELIGKLLEYSDEETLTKAFLSLKIVDEETREKYYDAFRNKESIKISGKSSDAITQVASSLFENPDAFFAICKEENITTGVMAKSMSMLVEINDNKPLLTDSSLQNGKLEYKYISSTVQKLFKESALLGTNKEEFLSRANESSAITSAVKIVGEEIGFYEAKKTPSNNKPGGSIVTNPTDSDNKKYESFKIDAQGTFTKEVSNSNVMLYKVEGENLIPQTFFVVKEGKLIANITKAGTYALKEMKPVFADSVGLWGESFITNLYYRGIISGRSADTFDPNGKITREEFVKLLCELFDLSDNGTEIPFTDVPRDAWFYQYVAAAYQNGLLNGVSATEFGTGANILRQDMCKIICAALEKTSNMPSVDISNVTIADEKAISEYAQEYVKELFALGMLSGNEAGEFLPKNNATRQETAKIVYNMIALIVK